MHNKDDLTIWEEYTKSVIKLKKPNVFVKQIKYIKKPLAYRTAEYQILFNNQKALIDSFISVHKLLTISRKRQHNFKSEAKIDLHGLTIQQVNDTLIHFCTQSIMYNLTYITIITGKGKGIIKNYVKQWLHTNTQFVVEYFEIKDSNNSCGAFGIRLRHLK